MGGRRHRSSGHLVEASEHWQFSYYKAFCLLLWNPSFPCSRQQYLFVKAEIRC
jgi:hypothetical protein